MGKDVRIRGYLSKPKKVREQRSLGNTDLDEFHAAEGYAVNLSSATFRPAFVRPSVRYVPCHLLRSVLRTCKPVLIGSCLESFVSSSCKYVYVAFVSSNNLQACLIAQLRSQLVTDNGRSLAGRRIGSPAIAASFAVEKSS